MSQTNSVIRIGAFSVDLNQVLGKGATGYVYKGFHQETHEPVAVKAIKMSQINNQVTQYLLEGEKRAMSTIKSPYIVKTHEIIQHRDYCYIIMELCSNGTLKEYIAKRGKLSCEEAVEMFRKIIIGYAAIVDSLFIHRDLKTANILLKSNLDPAIIDFGYCQMIMGKRPMIAYNVGSPSYMSPQAHSKNRYSQKSDIWSLGVIFYEMLTGKTLDNGLNIKEFFKIVEREGKVRINTQGMTKVCIQLLEMALQVDPQKRGTVHKLKYIIDKSMIPFMQAQLKKALNFPQTTKAGSAKFVPAAHFKYEPPTKQQKQQKQKQTKEKIETNIKFLRNSDQYTWNSSKIIPSTPSTPNSQISFNSVQERNQQSLIYLPPKQNNSPEVHPILRKSLEKSNVPRTMMKKMLSFKQIEYQTNFRRIPILQKTLSMQQIMTGSQNRVGTVNIRII